MTSPGRFLAVTIQSWSHFLWQGDPQTPAALTGPGVWSGSPSTSRPPLPSGASSLSLPAGGSLVGRGSPFTRPSLRGQPPRRSRLCLYQDGAGVTEELFQRIPENTELVLLGPGETWHGYVGEIQHFLNAFSNQTDNIVRAAQGLLSKEEAPNRCKLLGDLLQNLSGNISAENRGEDEKWFEGVESRFKTKSSYMRYNCESRIRGYMKEVGSYASVLYPALQAKYKQIVEAMLEKLKSERYNGCYFDRTEDNVSLCTSDGWFSCQGSFDTKMCLSKHSINPYGNRESRILFSTWNLDHVIEKKRTILPTLVEALQDQSGRKVDWEYFYRLLFTVDNLKLVHIACHKKSSHNLNCNKRKIFQKHKQRRRIPK